MLFLGRSLCSRVDSKAKLAMKFVTNEVRSFWISGKEKMTSPVDVENYYNTHLPAAQALLAGSVLTTRVDPDLAIVNIATGMHVVTEHANDIVVHFPKVNLAALQVLPEIALAFKYASLRAEQEVPAESLMAAKLAEARDFRARLLAAAKSLAENDLIPAAEVAAIVAGRGVRDRAEDCVALSALFRNHAAAIAGKHPITTDVIDQAAAVGSWLLANLRPAHAPNAPAAGPSAAVEIRNRFATLLVHGHDKLQAIAHYFHPSDWEERVPALGSRRATRKPEAPANP